MSADPTLSPDAVQDGEVMAAVDGGDLLIADVCRDGAWLSMPADRAPVLAERR